MPLNRAYSLLTVKEFDVTGRRFSGIATTPSPDRVDDIIEPLGVKFANPLNLHLFHDTTKPVGIVTFGRPSPDGIPFEAEIPDVTEPGLVRDYTEQARHLLKYGLIRAVSIGFRSLNAAVERLKSGGIRYLKTEVMELSMVSIPANAEALIHTVKHFDVGVAASGLSSDVSRPSAGVSAPVVHMAPKDARTMANKTLAEQLSGFEATRQAKSARMTEIMTKAGDEGVTLDAEQTEEYDGLETEVKAIDAHLVRLAALEKANAAVAKPVNGSSPDKASESRGGSVITLKETLPKGTLFTRYAMAVAAGRGSYSDTLAFAKQWDPQTPEVSKFIDLSYRMKAVEGTAAGASPSWGGELVYATNLVSEFIDLLREATIVGRITGIRHVPFNVRIPVQTGGSTVNWVGEAAPKPVTELAFDAITLGHNKIAGIVVLTEELVRLSSPSAEETVRRDLVEQIARFMDAQFITPSVAAGANNPASVTNGVTPIAATGVDADALYKNLNAALATFDNTDIGTNSLVLVMPPALARGISTLRNALGQFEFAGVNMGGGSLSGFPVLVSSTVPAGYIVIIKADEILMADDGKVTLDASNEATLDMNGGSTPTFNLWQKNCVGIRAERWVTWRKRRSNAVAVISGAAYGPA